MSEKKPREFWVDPRIMNNSGPAIAWEHPDTQCIHVREVIDGPDEKTYEQERDEASFKWRDRLFEKATCGKYEEEIARVQSWGGFLAGADWCKARFESIHDPHQEIALENYHKGIKDTETRFEKEIEELQYKYERRQDRIKQKDAQIAELQSKLDLAWKVDEDNQGYIEERDRMIEKLEKALVVYAGVDWKGRYLGVEYHAMKALADLAEWRKAK